jgi:hypothetical protein
MTADIPRVWRIFAASAWTAFILLLLLLPGNSVPSLPDWTLEFSPDKIVHGVLFFVHAVLLYGALMTSSALATRPAITRLAACGASVAFGGATELLQMLAIARSTSAADFLADGIGTALAFLFLIRQAKRIS